MRRRFRTLNLSGGLLLLLLLAAGCESSDRLALGPEGGDPQYRRGQQLLKQGRNQEALGAFLKVIERRGDGAPESHLEAGLLYQQHLKDPIVAIYHFRKYVELRPNSRQVDLVRQRIDAAMRDFARTLPAQPLESQVAKLELMGRIDALQKENLQLKEQIAALYQGGAGTRGPAAVPPDEAAPSPAITRGPLFTPPGGNSTKVAAKPAPAARVPAVSAPASGRRHVVAQGETLYKIAQRYYGSGSKWPEILEANRDVLKSENAVRPGMELRIP
ncbi:MAG: LysM peptidoglycan-binding domain-containing protein [Opitutaceae bacterium]|nr:LysM peptidoglycan-binding domain-containing protein [Opitutaceae bacterium]